MNGYIVFYENKPKLEVYAKTSYEAYEMGVAHFKPPKSKRHLVHAHLAEVDGKTITHIPS